MRIKKFDSWKDKDSLILIGAIVLTGLIGLFLTFKSPFPKTGLVDKFGIIHSYKCYQRKSYSPNKLSWIKLENGETYHFENPYGEKMKECNKKEKGFFVGRKVFLKIDPNTSSVYEFRLNNDLVYTYEDRISTNKMVLWYLWGLFGLALILYLIKR